MAFEIAIFVQLVASIIAYDYEQPIPATLWNERCKKNSHVFNECNWCWCASNHQYRCHARVCSQVDMFGHFNDAIRDIDVGMEGKGAWRAAPTACTPGVYYWRGSVLCVCNEDGFWPNAVCRDIFRVLHPVEVTRGVEMYQKCEPTKLYLIECNVCFCPNTGRLKPKLCTNTTCVEGDPLINATRINQQRFKEQKTVDMEVYATCNTNKKYSIGCQTCSCLKNNRLLCDNCTTDTETHKLKTNQSLCDNHDAGEVFTIDCNHCFCDSNNSMYCTMRRCLHQYSFRQIDLNEHFDDSPAPIIDHECTPGTKYTKDCNTCYCSEKNGETINTCTLTQCTQLSQIDAIQKKCVNNTIYESSCLICRCDISIDTLETCVINKKCTENQLELSHGYCHPFKVYKKDCNVCQCLSNGKVMRCTARLCNPGPITVDLVPVKAKHPENCPTGSSYMLDCNVCFCLENGNAICTSNDCKNISDNW